MTTASSDPRDPIDPREDRRLRLFLQHGASGVWSSRGYAVWLDEGFPEVSAPLWARIEAWHGQYNCYDCSTTLPEFDPAYDIVAVNAEGEAIAAALREALPGWTIDHAPLMRDYRKR